LHGGRAHIHPRRHSRGSKGGPRLGALLGLLGPPNGPSGPRAALRGPKMGPILGYPQYGVLYGWGSARSGFPWGSTLGGPGGGPRGGILGTPDIGYLGWAQEGYIGVPGGVAQIGPNRGYLGGIPGGGARYPIFSTLGGDPRTPLTPPLTTHQGGWSRRDVVVTGWIQHPIVCIRVSDIGIVGYQGIGYHPPGGTPDTPKYGVPGVAQIPPIYPYQHCVFRGYIWGYPQIWGIWGWYLGVPQEGYPGYPGVGMEGMHHRYRGYRWMHTTHRRVCIPDIGVCITHRGGIGYPRIPRYRGTLEKGSF
jgi:hypothetical protein